MPQPKKAAPTEPKTRAKRTPSQPKHMRNVLYVPISIRLDTGRRIDLKPRGQRGDSAPVQKGEETDDKFAQNKGILFEVITSKEAQEIIGKQDINRHEENPALKAMRNHLGEKYAPDAIKVTISDREQAVAVDVDVKDGNIQIDRGVGIRRAQVPGSDSYDLTASSDPQVKADLEARVKGDQNAHDILQDINVHVEAPQKS